MRKIEEPTNRPLIEFAQTTSGFGGKSSEITLQRETPEQIPVIKGADIGYYELTEYHYFHFKDENLTGRTRDEDKLGFVPKLLLRKTGLQLYGAFDGSGAYPEQSAYFLYEFADRYSPLYLLSIINSAVFNFYYRNKLVTNRDSTPQLKKIHLDSYPIPSIVFSNSDAQRKEVVANALPKNKPSQNDRLMQTTEHYMTLKQTDVVHDVLAHLAQTMIDLNKQKQAEVRRFLGWLEGRLKIRPKNGAGGLDSLTGKTILQGYLGDYQKGEREISWEDFYYRLHQNRGRVAANLAQIKGQIQQEYEASLAVLRPIKRQLADTDALIDQIVYKLYGLSDEEIELIERPAYEQALSEAKAKVVKDKELQKDPEAAADVIAKTILPAAQRLQSRVPHQAERERLTQELPGWETLPGDAPTFLLSGEYDLATRPEQLDFSSTVISFAKAVEQVIIQRIFEPFQAAGYTAADCDNKVLQGFMQGNKKLTVGSFAFIFTNKEKALQAFAEKQYPGCGYDLFFAKTNSVRALLNDQTSINRRNRAAHDEVLSKEDARNGRAWALAILKQL